MDEVKANPGFWRGFFFDSQLERDWYATFCEWGVRAVPHPGQLRLSDGTIYEPDFLLPEMQDGAGVLFEAKGWADDRIWKPRQAALEAGLDVVIGREGFVPPDPGLEFAGARWEGVPDRPGDPIVLAMIDGAWEFIRQSKLDYPLRYDVRYSADQLDSEYGIRMFKAVGDEESR